MRNEDKGSLFGEIGSRQRQEHSLSSAATAYFRGRLIMFAVIAIGVTVAIFGLLNLIDYRRID